MNGFAAQTALADPWRRAPWGRHAIADDVERVSAELSLELQAGTDGDQYVICSLAEALGRNPGQGSYEVLDKAFIEMPYSFGRRFVADAIAATNPRFPVGLAIDCLWDAQPEVRAVGARYASRDDVAAARRLDALRTDPHEDPAVRTAAT